jgi:putative (di)nucleoside polyphosphate hydrolase
MIDADGFRANVGIILTNSDGQALWAKRIYPADAWQFPQGGIQEGEDPESAMFRELHEELGLREHQVRILGVTADWLTYRLPKGLIRQHQKPVCIGQKQRWFVLALTAEDSAMNLSAVEPHEFDDWQWVDWTIPAKEVVAFKRDVYQQATTALAPFVTANTEG